MEEKITFELSEEELEEHFFQLLLSDKERECIRWLFKDSGKSTFEFSIGKRFEFANSVNFALQLRLYVERVVEDLVKKRMKALRVDALREIDNLLQNVQTKIERIYSDML